uniref:RAB39B, member RAS onco family n=1 Tax=Equus caballus TaxID=9796 RepID=F7E1Z1_HORSE
CCCHFITSASAASIPALSLRLGLPRLGLPGQRCARGPSKSGPSRALQGLGGAPPLAAHGPGQGDLPSPGHGGHLAVPVPAHCHRGFHSGSITRAYYRNSVGGLLLFDITNRRSFQNVHEWLEETKVHVQPYQIVFVLVGHKCDLDTQRQVTRHEAEKLAAAYGMKYIETSARDAINVEKAFTDLTRDIYELVKRGDITIQEGWEGVKSGFVPNVVHSSEEVVKSERRCLC